MLLRQHPGTVLPPFATFMHEDGIPRDASEPSFNIPP